MHPRPYYYAGPFTMVERQTDPILFRPNLLGSSLLGSNLLRPRRPLWPAVILRKGIEHGIDDRFSGIAIGHHHRPLPARGACNETAAKTQIVAALHRNKVAAFALARNAEPIAEIVDRGKHDRQAIAA